MTRLVCPFCGARELGEFAFHTTLPAAGGTPFERTYLRVDAPRASREAWQHLGGCRAWLTVTRDPWSGEVHEVVLEGGAAR